VRVREDRSEKEYIFDLVVHGGRRKGILL